jgi:hypothetical protein
MEKSGLPSEEKVLQNSIMTIEQLNITMLKIPLCPATGFSILKLIKLEIYCSDWPIVLAYCIRQKKQFKTSAIIITIRIG